MKLRAHIDYESRTGQYNSNHYSRTQSVHELLIGEKGNGAAAESEESAAAKSAASSEQKLI